MGLEADDLPRIDLFFCPSCEGLDEKTGAYR